VPFVVAFFSDAWEGVRKMAETLSTLWEKQSRAVYGCLPRPRGAIFFCAHSKSGSHEPDEQAGKRHRRCG